MGLAAVLVAAIAAYPLFLAGLPLMFVIGMTPSLVPPGLRVLASVGSRLTAVGLLVQAGLLLRMVPAGAMRWLWGFRSAC